MEEITKKNFVFHDKTRYLPTVADACVNGDLEEPPKTKKQFRIIPAKTKEIKGFTIKDFYETGEISGLGTRDRYDVAHMPYSELTDQKILYNRKDYETVPYLKIKEGWSKPIGSLLMIQEAHREDISERLESARQQAESLFNLGFYPDKKGR